MTIILIFVFVKQIKIAWCNQARALRVFYPFILCSLGGDGYARDDVNPPTLEPPSIGNFALPTSQQPGPLFSFGQTLIGKNSLQLTAQSFSPYHFGGAFDVVDGSLTYGFTDNTSVYFLYPIKSDYATRQIRRTAINDVVVQLEQSVYNQSTTHFQDQATVVGSISLPLSDANTLFAAKTFGAPSYFLGTTINRTTVDWLGFVSNGFMLTPTSNHVKLGSQLLYQAGVGRNILSVSEQSILTVVLECDGLYTEKNRVDGVIQPNSGSNYISLIPSLWFATKKFIINAGIGYPVVQHLNGNQNRTNYFLLGNLIITMN